MISQSGPLLSCDYDGLLQGKKEKKRREKKKEKEFIHISGPDEDPRPPAFFDEYEREVSEHPLTLCDA